MTNQLMPLFKQDMLSDYLTGATLKMILVDTNDHAFNAADEFLDDITAGAIVDTSPALTGVTFTNGVLDGTVPAFTSVTGDQSEALYLYIEDGGGAGTSRLIAHWDSATGLPITPDGNNINVTVSTNLFAL